MPAPQETGADLRVRLLDAALECVARYGASKTTLDDVARAAGCARATVYRYFPGKQALLAAAVVREADRLGAQVVDAARAAGSLADAAVAVVTEGARLVAGHAALRRVMTVEPEAVLPHISFERGDALLAEVERRVGPAFVPFVTPETASRLAEWLTRISLSYLCSAEEDVLADAAQVRSLVEDFVLPGIVRPATSPQGVLQ